MTKIMANKLKNILHKIISKIQSGFMQVSDSEKHHHGLRSNPPNQGEQRKGNDHQKRWPMLKKRE
jgi:hypothetical protein